MARKPKGAGGNPPADDIRTPLAVPIETPSPARRGRKPKATETPAEPLATMDSDDMTAGSFDADASISVPSEKPARVRPGPKPKPRGIEAAKPVQQVKRKPGRPRNPVPAPEPEPAQNSGLDTGPAVNGAPVTAGPDLIGPDSASPVKPAAQWDRAMDTVQFDWPAIEQTASQDGPNQVMAKLLIAARAEGANSRWPL